MNKTYYLTTPIYYPSGNPHIGHCYTTVACDTIARFKRMQGYDVMFLTGTDEHGQKIELKAAEKGVTPKEYVDEIVANFKRLWETMHISYDRFIRTTDDYHIETVQKIFKKLYEKGYIYKGTYKGKYCTNSGRGPINAISPFSTLISCGNSSIEVERTKRPTGVRRSASGSKLPSASRSSVIVLNLITLNIFPFRPGRS